jgi:hypothetical protein
MKAVVQRHGFTLCVAWTALVGGFLQLTYPALGRSLPGSFYETIATVIPVVLLALMVELAGAFPVGPLAHDNQQLEREVARFTDSLTTLETTATEAMNVQALASVRRMARRIAEISALVRDSSDRIRRLRTSTRWIVRGFFLSAAIGEAASLYAIGASRTSTLLLWLCISTLVILGVGLWVNYEFRFEAH